MARPAPLSAGLDADDTLHDLWRLTVCDTRGLGHPGTK
jgi:hypothetical protein